MRTKLCPVGPKSHELRTTQARSPAARLAVELRPAVGRERARAVGLDVRRALAAVEDVVGRVGDERRAELGRVRRAADVHLGRALRDRPRRRRRSSRPPRAGRGRARSDRGGRGKRTSQSSRVSACTSSAANAAASATPSWPPAPVIRTRRRGLKPAGPGRRASASRVLHRPFTRGSSQGMPCSSGSAASYSSVTW